MKVKIFTAQSGVTGHGEDQINEWLEKNPDISITKIKVSSNRNRFNTYIFYEETIKIS